jgi:hypothetical protein
MGKSDIDGIVTPFGLRTESGAHLAAQRERCGPR